MQGIELYIGRRELKKGVEYTYLALFAILYEDDTAKQI
jgi:hypothetical protein